MKHSQKLILLEAFKRGEKHTAHSAYIKLNIATLSQRINDIERMGYQVHREWVKSANAKFMIYWIPADQFKKIDYLHN